MVSSFPKMQKSSASFSQSIRNRLRLRKNQAQAKNFCRVLDIRVTKVMDSGIRGTDFCSQLFEVIVGGLRVKMCACGLGENKICRHLFFCFPSNPIASGIQTILNLAGLPSAQRVFNIAGNSQYSTLVVFQGSEHIPAVFQWALLQLTIDPQAMFAVVDTIPGQPKCFPQTKSCKDHDP